MQRFSLVAFVLPMVLAACGHRPETGESIAEVCQIPNNGKLKAVSGYIGSSPTRTSCTTTCTLKLQAQKGDDKTEMDVGFVLGSGNNQLEDVPENFSESDIRIKDNAGKTVHGGDVARITGRLTVNRRDDKFACSIEVTKVERLSGLM